MVLAGVPSGCLLTSSTFVQVCYVAYCGLGSPHWLGLSYWRTAWRL